MSVIITFQLITLSICFRCLFKCTFNLYLFIIYSDTYAIQILALGISSWGHRPVPESESDQISDLLDTSLS